MKPAGDPEAKFASRRSGVLILLAVILAGHTVISALGIRWGLPSARTMRYLFSDGQPWSGEALYRLAGTSWSSGVVGADVDVDPLTAGSSGPVVLNATQAEVARLYLRYLLYTCQPDEMIVMRALGGMQPAELKLDPRLYQYGGLFLYPLGGLLKLCDGLGCVDVRGDVAFYLDQPDAFGRFYILARAYAAAWGWVGALAVFGIARRLGGWQAGLLAAALFVVMPVVICMSHEGKPHLPGAALMLAAVWLALRVVTPSGALAAGGSAPQNKGPIVEPPGQSAGVPARRRRRDWWGVCAACGAAMGMVLSSLPVLVLIPLVSWFAAAADEAPGDPSKHRSARPRIGRYVVFVFGGAAIAGFIYAATNPYVILNLFINRDVLRSNFGNSLAMYEVARVADGFVRVAELTVEGAGPCVAVAGLAGLLMWIVRRRREALPLVAVAAALLVQFTLIGAGKPAEYGRFGVFADAALAIGAACLATALAQRLPRALITSWVLSAILLAFTAQSGAAYLRNFIADEGPQGARTLAAAVLQKLQADEQIGARAVAVLREPAPYACPPLDFSAAPVLLYPTREAWAADYARQPSILVETMDEVRTDVPAISRDRLFFAGEPSPISWANKPIALTLRP